jgi:hypothetical protein
MRVMPSHTRKEQNRGEAEGGGDCGDPHPREDNQPLSYFVFSSLTAPLELPIAFITSIKACRRAEFRIFSFCSG